MDDRLVDEKLPPTAEMQRHQDNNMMMDNNNDNEMEMTDIMQDLFPFDMSGIEDAQMIDGVNTMSMYPIDPIIPSEEEVMIYEEPEVKNNQDDQLIIEAENPYKEQSELQKIHIADPSLYELNGRMDDMEEKEFFDLDKSIVTPQDYSNPQEFFDDGHTQFFHDSNDMEYQIETKGDFAQYMQLQDNQVYRVEFQPQFNNDVNPILARNEHPEDIDTKFLIAPTPNSMNSPFPTIDSYFEQDMISNNETSMTPRSRKMSTTSSCGGKIAKIAKKMGNIGFDKTFRKRATKADMQALTEDEQKDRKKGQNRQNAKNCVARKNETKKELKERIPILEQNLKLVIDNNGYHEDKLITAYQLISSKYQNNAPFGTPEQFSDQLDFTKKGQVEDVVSHHPVDVIKSELEFKALQSKFNEIQSSKPDPKVPANTHASRKSRAKTAKETAEFLFKTQKLELEIQKSLRIGAVLERFTEEINENLAGIGAKSLPKKIVYNGFIELFEPS